MSPGLARALWLCGPGAALRAALQATQSVAPWSLLAAGQPTRQGLKEEVSGPVRESIQQPNVLLKTSICPHCPLQPRDVRGTRINIPRVGSSTVVWILCAPFAAG